MEKAYKFRLYPNTEQKELLAKTFGCARFVYNYYLDRRIKAYQQNKTTMNYNACSADLTKLKQEKPWLKEVDKFALQNALKDLDRAFQNFFREIDFGGKKAIILGGAYSVDKPRRLARGMKWWADEQPSDEIKARVGQVLSDIDFTVDYVFSHTCPERVIPKEKFLPHIDQSTVDRSTEQWLGGIEGGLKYSRWYCGHWHTDKVVEKIRFMFNDFVELGK